MNLWRNIPPEDKAKGTINVVVEVISGSRDKYEYNVEWEAFVLDRVLYSSVAFPVEYGFIPQTWYHDDDPLDAMVLSYEPLEVGCIVRARPVGVLVMEDESGEDPKILCVPTDDPRFNGINYLADIQSHILKEIQEFFETYKRLEPHKWSRFKTWKDSEDARKLIDYGTKLFKEKKS
ncbi:MAG: inorganic diphosphatase [Candidatus Bathyarchaeia archaeon]